MLHAVSPNTIEIIDTGRLACSRLHLFDRHACVALIRYASQREAVGCKLSGIGKLEEVVEMISINLIAPLCHAVIPWRDIYSQDCR